MTEPVDHTCDEDACGWTCERVDGAFVREVERDGEDMQVYCMCPDHTGQHAWLQAEGWLP